MEDLPEELLQHGILPYLEINELCQFRRISSNCNQSVISYLGRLKILNISKVKDLIDEDGLGAIISYLKELKYCDLSLCWRASTVINLKILANRCSKLEILKLKRCKYVTDEVILNLADRCKNITHLDVGGCWSVSVYITDFDT